MLIRGKLFDGEEKPIIIYNGKAIINLAMSFFDQDCVSGEEVDGDFAFPGFASAYMRINNERLGRLIKTFVLTRSGNELVLNVNASDMTFDDNGTYYYEIGYSDGVYEYTLAYGKATVI